ncbi:MAG: site-2 protease family protein [Candidatus Thermoplasmatota archaeon]
MASQIPPDASKEIETVKALVARYFPVYDVKVDYDVVQFYCRIDDATLEENFDRLREDMAPHGYIPMVTYDKGEHVIMVGRRPPARYRSIYVNLAMLVITFLAMMFAGILDWASYADVPGDEMFSAVNVLTGILVFTLPLMAILGVHELGHYYMARRRKVAASLPFFIPSVPPLGTFGAFISLRDPIPSRKSLLEIGVAGPLAGLALAIPIGILGLVLTNMEARPVPDDIGAEGLVQISFPMIYLWLEQLVPIQGEYLLHPTAFAAWVGFLVTALNLLPAGQLDGGHIARALFGKDAKYASWAAIAVLIGLSIFYWSWLLFAILILFLGAKHPPPLNDITKLDTRRKLVGVLAFVVLIVAFVPIPMSAVLTETSFDMASTDGTDRTVVAGTSATFHFIVNNTGNAACEITFEMEGAPDGWYVEFSEGGNASYDSYVMALNVSEEAVLTAAVSTNSSHAPGDYSVVMRGDSVAGTSEYSDNVTLTITLTPPPLEAWVLDDGQEVAAGSGIIVHIQLNNTGDGDLTVYLGAWDFVPYAEAVVLEGEVTVPADGNLTVAVEIVTWSSAEPGEKEAYVNVAYLGAVVKTVLITFTVV